MTKAEKSPRSVQYALAVIRQVFNHAYRAGVFSGENPVKQVKIQKAENTPILLGYRFSITSVEFV